jgi:hypothetical protein
MTNPKTGRPAASAVIKTDDICRGPRRSDMPDLVILWDADAQVTTELLVERHGLVRKSAASCQCAPYYTGNHVPHAFAVALGPDVPTGAVHTGRSVLDLAPTILTEFGIAPPEYMPGAVLTELRRTPTSTGTGRRTGGEGSFPAT